MTFRAATIHFLKWVGHILSCFCYLSHLTTKRNSVIPLWLSWTGYHEQRGVRRYTCGINHRVKNEKVLQVKNFRGKRLKSKQTIFTWIPPRQIQLDMLILQFESKSRGTQARWDLKNHQASINSPPCLVLGSLADPL